MENDSKLLWNHTSVLQEVGMSIVVVTKLKKELAIATREKDVLHHENAIALSELQETQKIVTALNAEAEKWNDERSRLVIENADLKAELVSYRNSQAELRRCLEMKADEITSKNQEFNGLEEHVEELRRCLEMKADEISSLVENLRNTEVKEKLTRQKLHVTEQMLGEKDENFSRKEEKYREEQKLLEERVAKLAGTIAVYSEAHKKIVIELSDKIGNILSDMDTFHMKFEEDNGHFESRIYELGNELKATRNWIRESNDRKDQKQQEIAGLVQQLNDEKDQELILKRRIGDLEIKLQKEEDEKRSLITSVHERDEQLGELEQKIKEKEVEFVSLGEEKREAIRQLCISIEYHRDRYDNLKTTVMKTRGLRRQFATT